MVQLVFIIFDQTNLTDLFPKLPFVSFSPQSALYCIGGKEIKAANYYLFTLLCVFSNWYIGTQRDRVTGDAYRDRMIETQRIK